MVALLIAGGALLISVIGCALLDPGHPRSARGAGRSMNTLAASVSSATL
jgi:hypothetical protein